VGRYKARKAYFTILWGWSIPDHSVDRLVYRHPACSLKPYILNKENYSIIPKAYQWTLSLNSPGGKEPIEIQNRQFSALMKIRTFEVCYKFSLPADFKRQSFWAMNTSSYEAKFFPMRLTLHGETEYFILTHL
jgi:hypothetical protein